MSTWNQYYVCTDQTEKSHFNCDIYNDLNEVKKALGKK